MKTKNIAFRDALIDSRLKIKKDAVPALDALLVADHKNASNFRQAVIKHGNVWNGLGAGFSPFEFDSDKDEINFLNPNGSDTPKGKPDEKYNFSTLKQLAVEQRILLTLSKATEKQLENLIMEMDEHEFRKLLGGTDGKTTFPTPAVSITGWDYQDETIITRDAITRIKGHAKTELLIRKVNGCKSIEALEGLNESDTTFKSILTKSFGISESLANRLDKSLIENADLARARAKKINSLKIAEMELSYLSSDIILQDLRKNNKQFKKSYDVADEDVNEIRGLLGARYLSSPLVAARINNENVELIATIDDISTLKSIFNGIKELEGDYIEQAVTDHSLPSIRQTYATEALQRKISQCDDLETLDALVNIKSVPQLQQLLATKPALGYSDNAKFREVFTDTKSLNSFIAAAHVRKNVSFSNQPNSLKALVENPAQFAAVYHAKFSDSTMDKAVKDSINEHFKDPKNIREARERAFIAFAKLELGKVPQDELLNIVSVGDISNIKDMSSQLFSTKPSPADDLFGKSRNEGIAKEFLFYATLEFLNKYTKGQVNFSGEEGGVLYETYLRNINTFTFGLNPQVQQILHSPEFPAKEKQKIKAQMVELLLRNFPGDRVDKPQQGNQPPLDKLAELAKAKDRAQFENLLANDFGITDKSWINAETMEQMQKIACNRSIALNRSATLSLVPHPQLFHLIHELPLEKQRELLTNKPALVALASAKNKEEVNRVLGDKQLANAEQIKNLVNENKILHQIGKIANAEIVRILSEMYPPVDLDLEQIKEINELLFKEEAFDITSSPMVGGGDTSSYQETIKGMDGIINYQNKTAFYNAFGLEAFYDDLGLVKKVVLKNPNSEIEKQHNYNSSLVELNESYKNERIRRGDRAILLILLTLDKKKALTEDEAKQLVEDIKTEKTYSSFVQLFKNPKNNRSYAANFEPDLDLQLTPQFFDLIKYKSRLNALISKGTYQGELKKQLEEIEAMKAKFSAVELTNDAKKQLERIVEIQPIYWFNPAFQATAKQNAATLGKELRELSELTDKYLTHLKNQKYALQEQKAILSQLIPSKKIFNKEQRQAIREQFFELKSHLEKVNEEIARYASLELIFKGDKTAESNLLQNGLIKTLDEAETGKFDLEVLSSNSYSILYDDSEKASHFEQGYQGGADPRGSNGPSIETDAADEKFEIVDAIPPGKFRETTVITKNPRNNREEKGIYIEERSARNLEPRVEKGGQIGYQTSMKLSAIEVPASHEGKIALAMSMATKTLASIKLPLARSIKVNGGNDPVFAKYLRTALDVLIENDPNMKIPKEKIQLRGAKGYNPDEDTQWFGMRYTDDAKKFREAFINHPDSKDLMDGVKEVNEKRYGNEKDKLNLQEDTRELTKFFKEKLKPVEEDNMEQEKASRAKLSAKL